MSVLTRHLLWDSIMPFVIQLNEHMLASLDQRIDTFKKDNLERSFTYIYKFVYEFDTYYIFDGGIAFDATASVLDVDCNVLCIYGGFGPDNPNPCSEKLMDAIGSAEQIWPE